jgi:hypothetical protein
MDPERADDLADKIALLGEPTAEFSVRGRRLVHKLILAPLLIVIGVVMDVGLLLAMDIKHVHFLKLIMFGAILIGMGVMLVVRAFRSLGLRVLAFPEGLLRVQRDDTQTLFWDEVQTVRITTHAGGWNRVWYGALVYTVERRTKPPLSFDDALPRLPELGGILTAATLPHLLRQARAAYDTGGTVAFGKLRVSRQGISSEKDTLPWHQLEEVKFDDTSVSIHKKGKWTKWFHGKLADFPNFHVLRGLIEQVNAERRAARVKKEE